VRILFGCSRADAWTRAANELGHEAFQMDPTRVFDSFAKSQPDLFVFEQEGDPAVPAALARYPHCKARVLSGAELFAADWLPRDPKPQDRRVFECDVAVVGDYRKEMDQYLAHLCKKEFEFEPDVKIFGRGPFPVPQHVGFVYPFDLPDLYYSAKVTVVFDDYNAWLDAWAAGGYPLYVRTKNQQTPETASGCTASTLAEFEDKIERGVVEEKTREWRVENYGDYVRKNMTYLNRIKEVLNVPRS
jgi:hypothetical protein